MIIGIIILLVIVLYFGRNVLFPSTYRTVDDKFNEKKAHQQREIDRILDKISQRGIESLSQKERQTLDEYSQK